VALVAGILVLSLLLVMTLCNVAVSCGASPFISSNMADLPNVKTGVVLGTNPYRKGGAKNEYFFNRIDAAVELFQQGKIRDIIVSGDNARNDYNEPLMMKRELVKRGIPDSVIYLDYAGFRTFDSMIRTREVFGQDSFIVISQEFHNKRAVYIARHFGEHAFGYNARAVHNASAYKIQIREFFARTKVFLDFLTGKQPHFLGRKVEIK